jgi:hypothetical protein
MNTLVLESVTGRQRAAMSLMAHLLKLNAVLDTSVPAVCLKCKYTLLARFGDRRQL